MRVLILFAAVTGASACASGVTVLDSGDTTADLVTHSDSGACPIVGTFQWRNMLAPSSLRFNADGTVNRSRLAPGPVDSEVVARYRFDGRRLYMDDRLDPSGQCPRSSESVWDVEFSLDCNSLSVTVRSDPCLSDAYLGCCLEYTRLP